MNIRSRAVGVVLALLAIQLATQSVMAQTIYRGKDAKGAPVFTDQPRPGDRPVELPPINTAPAPTAMPAMGGSQPSAFAGYSQIAVSAPGSVPNAFSPVNVSISIEPALQPGHLWQLRLDGAFIAAGRESGYTFARLEAGLHTLSLSIVGDSGEVLGEASPVSVLVRHNTRAN